MGLKFIFCTLLLTLALFQCCVADDGEVEELTPELEMELSKVAKCLWKVRKDFPKVKINLSIDWYAMVFKPGRKVVQAAKCFTRCFLQKSGLYSNVTQQFNMKAIKERLGSSVSHEFLDECAAKGQRKTKECSKAFTPFMCMLENEQVRKSLVATIYGKNVGGLLSQAKDKAKKLILKVFKKFSSRRMIDHETW